MAGRWYNQAQVDRGKEVFLENCAECHGRSAQGNFN
ncbi:c-type cytochrome [Pistricoccus aurantiacus]